ncbi:MAG: SLBB domain-containing protein [Pseudomonadota bacterium]
MRHFFAWVLLFALSTPLAAQQTPTPTPEQLRMLQSLPSDQQGELLKQFGLDSGSSSVDDALEFPQLTRPREQIEDVDQELRVVGNDTLVITFEVIAEDAEEIEQLKSDPLLSPFIGTRSYLLSDAGDLLLPGVATIPLAGLTEEQIALRLAAEAALSVFSVTANILPIEPTGVDALAYFGYELFEDVPTSFAPATDIPVTANYVMGPGDQVQIQLYGNENTSFSLVVSRDGDITLPEIGPISVAGLSFDAARAEIVERVSEQKIGVRTSVTLGELRSIRIFVLGDVNQPGSYTVSGLSSMTNAIFLSGGVSLSGSLRNIQLKRRGVLVGTLDLYDLLLNGDTSADKRLQPGDVIFVPPVGDRVGIEGEVGRPAYYELRGRTTAMGLVRLAGGLKSTAHAPTGRIERVTDAGDRQIIDADLSTQAGQSVAVQDGDVLRVFPVLDRLDDSVELLGHVRRPAQYQWQEGLRLTDLIPSLAVLKSKADLGYVLVRREIDDDGQIVALSTDLEAAFAAPNSTHNLLLQPRDQVIVFETGPARGARLIEMLDQLQSQANDGTQVAQVSIGGSVHSEGVYPLEEQMRVSDLIRAGGGFTDSAFLTTAELTRYLIGDDGARKTILVNVDLAAILAGDEIANLDLLPYDFLQIRETPEWRGQQAVTIGGEVRFPGVYPIKRGETLMSVLQRAGGLTDLSFVEGSVFTRESLKQREEEQIDTLISRLEADLASLALQSSQTDGNVQQAFTFGQSLLAQLRESEASGRLVIDLGDILANSPGSEHDITLKDGDVLLIPQRTQEVTVIGEVQYATSHLFEAGLDRDDYLASSGGLTSKADAKRIYVVRANGQVVASSGTKWLRRVGGTEIRPGDTIVVPIDADRIAPLTLWSSITQIVFNLAVAVTAINSF